MAGLSVWNGSSFVDGQPRIWNGSAFVAPSSCHVWDGSQFVKVWPTGIEFVSSATANSNTVAMPAHQAGDFLVCFATRNATSAPSLASGWTNIADNNKSNTAARIAYKIAGSSSESTGTWTNANSCTVHVYRGATAVRGHSIGDRNWSALPSLTPGDAVMRAMYASNVTPVGVPPNFTSRHSFSTSISSVRTCDRVPIDTTSQQADDGTYGGVVPAVSFTVALRT